MLSEDSDCEVPELQDSDGHVEAEKKEGFLVFVSDAGLGPDAVMVEFVDASATGATVGHSGPFWGVADLADFIEAVGEVEKLL